MSDLRNSLSLLRGKDEPMWKRRTWPWRSTVNSKCRVRFSQKRLSYYLHSQPCLRHVNYHMLFRIIKLPVFPLFPILILCYFSLFSSLLSVFVLSSSNFLPNSTAAWSPTLISFTCRFLCSFLDYGLALERDINRTRHFILHST